MSYHKFLAARWQTNWVYTLNVRYLACVAVAASRHLIPHGACFTEPQQPCFRQQADAELLRCVCHTLWHPDPLFPRQQLAYSEDHYGGSRGGCLQPDSRGFIRGGFRRPTGSLSDSTVTPLKLCRSLSHRGARFSFRNASSSRGNLYSL